MTKLRQILNEAITIPVEIGDTILVGRFKNKPIVVKTIEYDQYGLPVINGRKALTFRIKKKETNEVIEKRNGKWVVLTKDRKRVLGKHPSKKKALAQLRAIEIGRKSK